MPVANNAEEIGTMFKNILVAVNIDDTGNAEKILRIAADIANSNAARLHLLTVIGAAQSVVSQYLPEGYENMAMERTVASNKKCQLIIIAIILSADNNSA